MEHMERIRQAVIMVAGPGGTPAELALEPVAGVGLLKRTILTLQRAGIARVHVVLGGEAAAVRAALAGDAAYDRAGVVVEVVEPTGPTASDGDLLLAVRARVAAPFLLVAADHVHDVAALRLAIAADRGAAGVHVCVGPDQAPCGVHAIGAELLEHLAAHPGSALSAAIDALAARGRAATIAIGPAASLDARTPQARAAAQVQLLRSLTKPTDGFVARQLNRRVSRQVTRLLLGTAVTPNQISVLAGIIGFVGIALVARATWWSVLAGAFLVQLQSILDGCDGELARLKFLGSRFGEWLDNVIDDTMNIAYGVALGHAAAVLLEQPVYRWLGLATGVGYLVYNAVLYAHLSLVHGSGNPFLFRWWFQKQDAYLQQSLEGAGGGARLVGLLHAMGRRDLFLFAFLVFCALRQPHLATIWYVAIALVSATMAIMHVLAGGITSELRVRREAARR